MTGYHVLLIGIAHIVPIVPGEQGTRHWYDGTPTTWYSGQPAHWYSGNPFSTVVTWYDGTNANWYDGTQRTTYGS